MTIIRPAEDEGEPDGHSGKRFANPKHAEMLEGVLAVAPHLKAHLN
jgi:hypothetical protein